MTFFYFFIYLSVKLLLPDYYLCKQFTVDGAKTYKSLA